MGPRISGVLYWPPGPVPPLGPGFKGPQGQAHPCNPIINKRYWHSLKNLVNEKPSERRLVRRKHLHLNANSKVEGFLVIASKPRIDQGHGFGFKLLVVAGWCGRFSRLHHRILLVTSVPGSLSCEGQSESQKGTC